MVKCLSNNTGHGAASCPAHHLHRYRYDGFNCFDDDDLHDTWLHVVHNDIQSIDVHIDDHNDHIHHYNNRMCPISRCRYLFRKFSSTSLLS
ncbi:hypothetical protein WR25_09786 [Diploscapter pachys]|uniref:Uncharacterized protein n=1 Tax=Diploscapter pachys TaxID=2018661 RepID=A0A2A2KG63_9BILA|nr:hypothetical protein WR25_09786 [Diploscapter pachys]